MQRTQARLEGCITKTLWRHPRWGHRYRWCRKYHRSDKTRPKWSGTDTH